MLQLKRYILLFAVVLIAGCGGAERNVLNNESKNNRIINKVENILQDLNVNNKSYELTEDRNSEFNLRIKFQLPIEHNEFNALLCETIIAHLDFKEVKNVEIRIEYKNDSKYTEGIYNRDKLKEIRSKFSLIKELLFEYCSFVLKKEFLPALLGYDKLIAIANEKGYLLNQGFVGNYALTKLFVNALLLRKKESTKKDEIYNDLHVITVFSLWARNSDLFFLINKVRDLTEIGELSINEVLLLHEEFYNEKFTNPNEVMWIDSLRNL